MFVQKFIVRNDPDTFETDVNDLLDQGWQIVLGSIGATFAPNRNHKNQNLIWLIFEKEAT
jgi:hypothetical protein